MDIQATQTALRELLSNLKIQGTVQLDSNFDEQALRVDVKNLNPRLRKQLIDGLEAYPQVELDHEFTTSLAQKAYDVLRHNNPSHYIDLDPNFTKIAFHETTSFGRKVCELVQEVLIGHSHYSNNIWKKEELLNEVKTTLSIEAANAFVLNNDVITSLILDDTRVLDYKPNESITIETDAYRSVLDQHLGEIYGHFHADFTVTAKNEVSVELCCEDGATIYASGIAIITSQDGDKIQTDSDNLCNFLSDEAVKALSPTDYLENALIMLFKVQKFAWAFDDLVAHYNVENNEEFKFKSAFELAVERGFTGTETEWTESLKGQNGIDGAKGESAYDIAVLLGLKVQN